MKHLKYLVLSLFFIPSLASAHTLTSDQVNAIIGLLRAFGVAEAMVSIVEHELAPPTVTITPTITPTIAPTFTPIVTPTVTQTPQEPALGATNTYTVTAPRPAPLPLKVILLETLAYQGTYTLRVQTNKPVTASTDMGTLGEQTVSEHATDYYYYRIPFDIETDTTGEIHFFTASVTDQDGQTISKRLTVPYN